MPLPTHAIVLTAGLGTRLRPLTSVRAKAAIPVAGEPMARRIIRSLVDQGVTDLVLNLHHLPHTLTAVVGDGADLGARVRYSWEYPDVLGSAGGPRRALPIAGADPFFIVNGDTLTDVRLGAIADDHARTGALVTLALVPNAEPDRYGGVRLGADGHVAGFAPKGAAARGSFHFIGVQVAAAAAFAHVPDDVPVNSIGDAYDRLLAVQPDSIRGVVSNASFFDVGTVADYWRTSLAFSPPGLRAVVWDDVVIGEGAVLDECIVTDGVRVEPGSIHRREILLRGSGGRTIVAPLQL